MSFKYGARLLTLYKFAGLPLKNTLSIHPSASLLCVGSHLSRLSLHTTSSMACSTGGDAAAGNPNRLIESKSPYLLQHAYNPVDWYPWGEEAFAKARDEQKLVFLSVGYSTCHWCHVMEKESFENTEIAKLMNADFVCIKVDREERPDVDKIYMTFIQAIAGRGGWPMSVFMTPDLHPVFGGTYYPPDNRYYGQPGFGTILKSLAEQWKENPAKFRTSGDKIISVLKESASVGMASAAAVPDAIACATRCFEQLRTSYEPKFGGFSERPKFPQPVNLAFLLRWHVRQSGSEDDAAAQEALEMVVHTLRMMAKGGIFDHVSLGFARYSTDDQWHVPHFEKMLYDQAQLVSVYTDAYLVTGDADFARVAHDVLDYVERCLSDPSGGFYSAEDADSYPEQSSKAKREGAFCVWTQDEIQSLLGSKNLVASEGATVTLADLICHHFDIRPQGNVDPYQDPHDELKGKNVPIIRGSEQTSAAKLGLSLPVFRDSLMIALSAMRKARLVRPPPHLDDKMLAAWNGLMISAFAKAGAALMKDDVDDARRGSETRKKSASYVQRAIKAATFVRQHLFDPSSGRLIRSCYRSNAPLGDDVTGDSSVVQNSEPIFGFLDDYAFVIRGLLDLYATCQDQEWLRWADQLQQKQDQLFWDVDSGGYFTSAAGDASILVRLKEDQDGAEPSGNSVAAGNLVRLAVLVERTEYQEKASRLLRLFSERLVKVPVSLPEMLSALVLYKDSPSEVLIVGPSGDESAERLFRESLLHRQSLLGQLVVRVCDSLSNSCFLAERRPSLDAITSRHQRTSAAYLCRDRSCSSTPITSVQELRQILDHRR